MRLKFELILLVLLTILTIFAWRIWNKYSTVSDQLNNSETKLEVLTTANKHYYNKDSMLTEQTKEYEITLRELKTSNDSIVIAMAKVVKASNIKDKRIKSLMNISTKTIIKHSWDTTYLDTNSYPIYKYSDKWTYLVASKDSFNLINTNEYIITTSERQIKRNGFLGWLGFKKTINRNMVEVVSLNPNDKTKTRTIKISK